jgi:SPASM domain peptide maturase of grasp-with-spasm system
LDDKFLFKILDFPSDNIIRDLQVVLKYNGYNDLYYAKIHESNIRLSKLYIHSSPENKEKQLSKNNNLVPVFLSQEVIQNHNHCGYISPTYFDVNIDMYMESQQFNSCLNRKISIDTEGNIKNCPSMKKSFGNIQNTTLKEAIGIQGFKDTWSINKNQIEVCKDCEFRYMCTDCRAFIQDSINIYSQPAKCGYNPYIGLWKGEKLWESVEQTKINLLK